MHWRDTRILELVGIELPIIQAPMANAAFAEMAIAVSEVGGLGSLACTYLDPTQLNIQLQKIRNETSRPINLNFFCHQTPLGNSQQEARWHALLKKYYQELGIEWSLPQPVTRAKPFDSETCKIVEEFQPKVVSFHFGLPESSLVDRVKAAGAKVFSSATTVAEAVWLEENGCDAIIAQGLEAGGHRGIFLSQDLSTQVGTLALVPQIVDAVKVPVIAAGGITDSRGIAAVFLLGASAAQLGTAYLLCPEAKISSLHKAALQSAQHRTTAITNVFTGRPARSFINRLIKEVGPICREVAAFPLASNALSLLRKKAESIGLNDFSPLWAGQAASLAQELPAGELTKQLAAQALEKIASY